MVPKGTGEIRRQDMKKNAFALMVVAGLAGSAMASSVTTTFTSYGTATFTNKNSIDAQGDVDNNTDTFAFTGGGTVNAIRVSGNLTSVIAGTFMSEARVRMSAGAGNSFTAFDPGRHRRPPRVSLGQRLLRVR
jgi:Ca2+-binding RTX toxin-like protein